MIGKLIGLFVLVSGTMTADVLPDGGWTSTPWHVGERVRIRWSGFAANTTVSVRLWDVVGNRSIVIADSVAGDAGMVDWTVAGHLQAHPYYRLIVHDVRHHGRRQMSGGFVPVVVPMPKQHAASAETADIRVLPNPASTSAVVRWTGHYRSLMVQASDGRIVYRQSLPSDIAMAVLPSDEWAVGTYVAILVDDQGGYRRSPFVVLR